MNVTANNWVLCCDDTCGIEWVSFVAGWSSGNVYGDDTKFPHSAHILNLRPRPAEREMIPNWFISCFESSSHRHPHHHTLRSQTSFGISRELDRMNRLLFVYASQLETHSWMKQKQIILQIWNLPLADLVAYLAPSALPNVSNFNRAFFLTSAWHPYHHTFEHHEAWTVRPIALQLAVSLIFNKIRTVEGEWPISI